MRKEEAFECSCVANFILATHNAIENEITNLKMNKILYFIHGYFLAQCGVPLVRNHFECWENGPVIKTLYSSLKKYGRMPIERPICARNYMSGLVEPVEFDRVAEKFNPRAFEYLRWLVSQRASVLVSDSHVPGGPWDSIKAQLGQAGHSNRIPDFLIQRHFENKFGGNRCH